MPPTLTLEQFLADVERRAFALARFATGNRDDALDLVQEAMLRLARQYADRAPEEWPPLFQRILQSRIRDWYRRTAVRNRFRVWFGLDGGDAMATLADPTAVDPVDGLARQNAMTALDAALTALPMRQQQVFLLRVWEGLDVAQTAQAMGCSQGSVKTHFSRAVHKLRAELEGHES